MRLLYVGKYPLWHMHSYGGEEHLHKLAEQMADKGHDVYLANAIYAGNNCGITFKKLNYVHVPIVDLIEKKPFPLYPRTDELLKLIKEIKPDVIHHFAKFGFSVEQLRRNGRITCPTVNSVVASRTRQRELALVTMLAKGQMNSFITSRLDKYIIKNADVVIAPSTASKDILIKEFKTPLSKIHIIPRGVDSSQNSSWDNVIEDSIFCAGRLDTEKGIQYVIKAMEYILKENPQAKLIIAGSGPQEKKFKVFAHKIAPDHIVFLGKIPRSEMAIQYEKCNVFVIHSEFESFGAVAVEAMATGCPVVASNIGGLIDIVDNYETGILTRFGYVEGIASAIIRILSDRAMAKKMGEAGHKKVVEEYSWEKEADQIEEVYHALIG